MEASGDAQAIPYPKEMPPHSASVRRRNLLKKKPKTLDSFVVPENSATVVRRIVAFALQSSYRIEAVDELQGRIILSEDKSVFTFGFFFPIFLSSERSGKTLVEIGIRSKFYQVGPLVGKARERFVEGIKAAVLY